MGRITIYFMPLVEEYKIEKELQGKSGIYMWTSPSGKSYIGLAKNLGIRHKDFRCATDRRRYAGRNSLIDKARIKYPYNEWKYKIIEFCDYDQLGEKEQKYIIEYNTLAPNGYNITKGGIGGNGVPKTAFKKGHSNTEEEKLKKKETLRKHIEEGVVDYSYKKTPIAIYTKEGTLFKIFGSCKEAAKEIGMKGVSFSCYIKRGGLSHGYMIRYATEDTPLFIEPYQKKKIILSEEARKKMSIAKKGKPLAHLWKAVISTDKNGNEDYFNSINSAAENVHPENTKAAAKNIQCALKGRRASAYGRTWRYA